MSDLHQKHLRVGGDKGHLGKIAGNGQVHTCADGKGRFLELEHGRIYARPGGGVHEVRGAILDKWLLLGGEAGPLGYPTSDQRWVSDGRGRYSEFDDGVIWWSKATGAHAVRDDILNKYRTVGGPRGVLGYPTSDVKNTPDLRGTFNTFEHGSIHRRKPTSAFVVHGEVFANWQAQGGATGPLGFPLSDELPNPNINTRFNRFENGTLSRVVSAPPAFGPVSLPAPVRHAHDLGRDQLESTHKTHAGDGFRIRSLSLYGEPADPLYTCVWVKDGGPAQRMTLKASRTAAQAFLDDPANDGFVPVIVSATGPAASAAFALVCEKRSGPSPVLRLALVSGPIFGLNHPDTFNYWCQWARGNNHVLTCASIYGDDAQPRYAGIWELNDDEEPWNVAYHDAGRKVACNFMPERDPELFDEGDMAAIQKAQGFWARLTFATRSPHGRALRVFRPGGKGEWALRNFTAADIESQLETFKKDGFHPIGLQGARVGGESRFTVILSKHAKPQRRQLTITGTPAAALVAFDEAMADMMKNTGARAATLAIARNGQLRYARAFTWAEPGAPAVQPKDLFRIASCSKPITAVGTYRLVQDGMLTPDPDGGPGSTALDNTLLNNVTLTHLTGKAKAAGFDAITLRQLLQHRAGLQKPVADDVEILDAFNAAQFVHLPKHTLPISLRQAASYMATVPLEFSDGKEHYSNLGFHFLSLVIQQKTNQAYAAALQERLFTPIGVTRARITSSAMELADREVIALDRHLRVGRSVMETARPIVPHEYGTVNRNARPGSGGWIMSAADYVRFLSVLHLGSGALLDPATAGSDSRILAHGGAVDGAVAHIEHMSARNVTFAVFFAINFFGEFERRIRDIINALPDSAWAGADLFPDLLS